MHKPQFIDTHCHIYMDKFDYKIEEIINRAKAENVSKIICIGVDLNTSERCVELSNKYKEVYATVGIHPHESSNVEQSYLKNIENMCSEPKVIGVGEIGLDYHYTFSSKEDQRNVFYNQILLAKNLNLPIVVHNRNSDEDLYEIITKSNHSKGVIHCFTSNLSFAKKIINIGFYISFTGIITFSSDLEEVVESIPLNKILLETDSPYLSPIPLRGKVNEPKNIPIIANKIGDIKKITTDSIANQTYKNAHLLFKKL